MYLLILIAILCIILAFSHIIIKRLKIAALFTRNSSKIPIEIAKKLEQAKLELKNIQMSNNDDDADSDADEEPNQNSEYVRLIRQMRAQRKIDDLLEQIQQKHNAGRLHAAYLELMICYLIKTVLYVILIIISVRNRYTPVLVLGKQFNLQPLNGLLSFPTGIPNAISVPMWIVSCKVTFNLFSRLIK